MGFTYAWSNSFLTSYLRDVTDTVWTDVNYLGLSTTTPSIDGTGATEPASGYVRTAITAPDLNVAANRARDNSAIKSFSATADWGTVTHVLGYDTASAGNLVVFGALTASEQVFDTDAVSFPAGDLIFSLGGEITTYLANLVLDKIIGSVTLSPPGDFWIGLSTTAPAIDGTNVTEPGGGNYSRAFVGFFTTSWTVASNGSTSVAFDTTFNVATASWGTLTHWVIYDASSGGNLLFYAPLDASQAVTTDDQVKFLPGDLTITIT